MQGVARTAWAAAAALFAGSLSAGPVAQLSRTLSFPAPSLSQTPAGLTRVALPGCDADAPAGLPALPAISLSFTVPAGAEVASVTARAEGVREIPLAAPVEWGQPPRRPDDPQWPDAPPDAAVYGSAAPYPDLDAPAWRTDLACGVRLLSVRVPAVRVAPARAVLLTADRVTVTVELRPEAAGARQPPPDVRRAASLAPGSHTYVAVAPSNFISQAPAPWNLQALCEARAAAGFTPALVSLEWIAATYAGTNTAAKIRAFAQDARASWNMRYLLLCGTFDLLPVQRLYVSFSDFFTPRTAEIPADAIYYGCLDGPFDNNGNGRYGEVTDGAGGGDVDLAADVLVGRFPASNVVELAHLVRKALRYERAAPADVAAHAFAAEKVDFGTLVYADGFMNELRNGSTAYGLDAMGFKESPYAALFNADLTLYDTNGTLWAAADALAFLNRNLCTVNHIGHGAAKQCMKLATSNASHLSALRAFTNDMPYFIYSQACQSGAFDTPDCFAEQLVTVSNAAAAAVMNARDGWEYPNVIGGYSHRFHRAFWNAALRGTATRLGEINEHSRLANLSLISHTAANYWRWVYYELNLFGDPATPFAACVSVAPPALVSEPLANTYDTQNPYRVECTVEPVGIFDPGSVVLLWRSSRETALTHTQAMSQVTGNLFEGFIAPQPADTRVDYALTVRNHAGVESAWPADGESVFFVTERLTLTVLGSPFDYGAPDPAYGVHAFASGLVAAASAPALVALSEDTRVAGVGFFGTGSAPQSGTNLSAAFQMDASSLLVWQWQRQHRLRLAADATPAATQVFWVAASGSLAVPPAAALVAVSNGDSLAFAEWRLDGARSPALPARSGPDYGALDMQAPHLLTACYLPAALDGDANGVADWWEVQYYGTNGRDPLSDEDLDGFTLAAEFADRTDPRASASFPAPPQLSHAPLAETQGRPGPFTIRAAIADSHAVTNAAVRWHRRTEPWQDTPLLAASNGLFEAQIGALSAPGDDFESQLVAADPDGRVTASPVYFFFLAYPVADTSRFHDLSFVTLPTQTLACAYMNLHNTGNADLVWSMRFSRVESVLDPTLACWNRRSIDQPWAASTNRFASPPYALYSRLVSGGLSGSPPVHATIQLPPLLIGPNAVLTFNYWINAELYSSSSSSAYDGGIVEYSKDGGATFQQLRGPYTHTIHGWLFSPWTNGTPCLAGKGEGWRTAAFDLAQEHPEENGFLGRSVVFRFHYGGDNNTDKEGWYIDDVTVSPLLWQTGFSHSIESGYSYTIPAGGYKRILWCNLPTSMDVHSDDLTVTLLSNDPVVPRASFYWQLKIRDYPTLPGLFAGQSADGDGLVRLASAVSDADGEPVTLAAEWSPDGGATWNPAALTNVAAAFGPAPTHAPDGRLAALATSTNGVRATNLLSAAWLSRAAAPALGGSTQMLVRVAATNGYFGRSYTTPRFTVDNLPPAFAPGPLTCGQQSGVGPYALATNVLSLAWPPAADTPWPAAVAYRLSAPGGACTTALTSATAALTNGPGAVCAFAVTAVDAFGNASPPLTNAWLVLDPLGDFDGDGLPNAGEEVAGTLATSAGSRFTLALQPASGLSGPLALAWAGAPGRLYTVEASPALRPAAWQPVPGLVDIPGDGATITADLPDAGGARFFRLRVRLP